MIKEKTKKSFEDKISKLARKTQDNIKASKKSFERFCPECYDENYQVHYKQTLRERKEVRESKRPDLYAKTTNNQSILCFVN